MNALQRYGTRRSAIVPVALLLLAGCGDLTAGGAGEGEASVVGDTPIAAHPTPYSVAAPTPSEGGDPLPLHGTGRIEGDLQVTLQIFLRRVGDELVELTSGPTTLTVEADGSTSADIARRNIPTGSYEGVLLVFHDVEVEVRAGLPFTGTVTVDFAGQSELEVSRDHPFVVGEGERASVEVNLRTSAWANAAAPALPVVAAAIFRSAVAVEVTTGS